MKQTIVEIKYYDKRSKTYYTENENVSKDNYKQFYKLLHDESVEDWALKKQGDFKVKTEFKLRGKKRNCLISFSGGGYFRLYDAMVD